MEFLDENENAGWEIFPKSAKKKFGPKKSSSGIRWYTLSSCALWAKQIVNFAAWKKCWKYFGGLLFGFAFSRRLFIVYNNVARFEYFTEISRIWHLDVRSSRSTIFSIRCLKIDTIESSWWINNSEIHVSSW